MADYWGVEKYCPEMDDDKGTSLVFCHTNKGLMAFEEICNSFKVLPQEKENVLACNSCMVSQIPQTDKRRRFFRLLKLGSFRVASYVIDQNAPATRIKSFLKRMFA